MYVFACFYIEWWVIDFKNSYENIITLPTRLYTAYDKIMTYDSFMYVFTLFYNNSLYIFKYLP